MTYNGDRVLLENVFSLTYCGDNGESLFYTYLLESREEKRVVGGVLKPVLEYIFVFLFLPKIHAINAPEVS